MLLLLAYIPHDRMYCSGCQVDCCLVTWHLPLIQCEQVCEFVKIFHHFFIKHMKTKHNGLKYTKYNILFIYNSSDTPSNIIKTFSIGSRQVTNYWDTGCNNYISFILPVFENFFLSICTVILFADDISYNVCHFSCCLMIRLTYLVSTHQCKK
jgi:hypothetical protein